MKRLIVSVALILSMACVTNRAALRMSDQNRIYIQLVKLGQTTDEVQNVMRHQPESRDIKTLPDGTIEETWNYLTDYGNDTNTSLVFRSGKLAEIQHTRWLGNGTFMK